MRRLPRVFSWRAFQTEPLIGTLAPVPVTATQVRRTSARVACADDYPPVCEALQRGLDPERFTFAGAVSDIRSLDWLLEQVKPAILLLDLDMPGGERPLSWLARSAAKYPFTRVVVYSAHPDREFIDEAIGSGAWGYIVKGDEPARLSDLLTRVLEGQMVFSRSADVMD